MPWPTGRECLRQLTGNFRCDINFPALITPALLQPYQQDSLQTLLQLTADLELQPKPAYNPAATAAA
ncbi:MAG: hypothetical protein GX564_02220 [Oligosphaeraceae bacterium]|nr:hypothetical protein [Oligosphaeraceae bacterium]